MSETKWTPGPWNIARINYADIYGGDGEMVALVPKGYPRTAANAQLIAAAPDLYDALREISDALEGAKAANPEASIEFFDELVEIEPGWRKRLKDALAKARGETA